MAISSSFPCAEIREKTPARHAMINGLARRMCGLDMNEHVEFDH